MGNIKNYNFARFDLKLSNDDYWDYYLANDHSDDGFIGFDDTNNKCSLSWYDFNNPVIYSGNSIYSLMFWSDAINTGSTLDTFGLTGIDNGMVLFDKGDDLKNQNLLNALTGTTLIIPPNDKRLVMTSVSGNTGLYIYPIEKITDEIVGDYVELKGGFYQGFYKIEGYDYSVLPTRVEHSWSVEYWLNKKNTDIEGNILNNKYPNNEGFFFYMGTRAENKFWNQWQGADTGCTYNCIVKTGCTDTVNEWCTVPKELTTSIIDDSGFRVPLNPPRITNELITNPFLIYGRGCGVLGSETVCSYDGKGIMVTGTTKVITNKTNPFLIYGRATKRKKCKPCKGPEDGFGNETICSFSGSTADETKIDYTLDIHGLGFRIKKDGSIGYRMLYSDTNPCNTSGYTIQEAYSPPNIIADDQWKYVVVKFVTNYKEGCDLITSKPRTGNLMFYVDGYLKFIVKDFPEFIPRGLNEHKDKQVGVPYNMSIGGGTQGLIESLTFDGRDPSDFELPLETNFAGTFIGGISQFRFNSCDVNINDIRKKFLKDLGRYYPNDKRLKTNKCNCDCK